MTASTLVLIILALVIAARWGVLVRDAMRDVRGRS